MDSTMTICDSVATCVNKTAEICQHCTKEAETSCQDVEIVLIICVAIVIIAIFAIWRYFKWKDDERDTITKAALQKRSNEEADRKFKQNTDAQARKQNKEDHELKRKEELENKLHNYMESQIKNGKSLSKDDMYIDKLTKEIDEIKSALNDKEA